MSRRSSKHGVLFWLVVGGLALVGLALLFGKPRIAFGIAVVDPALPP